MKKKTIALLLVMMMIFGISVGGTIAYLTDSKTVKNTFTVGDVEISLTETKVNKAGEKVNAEGQTLAEFKAAGGQEADFKAAVVDASTGTAEEPVGNAYKLLPGMSYTKDPTVTVKADSEESYVRMLVKVSDMAKLTAAFTADYTVDGVFLLQNLVDWNDEKWEYIKCENNVYEFRYAEKVAYNEKEDTKLEPLFTTITLPGSINNDSLEKLSGVEITIQAHAIQTAGFADAADAWSKSGLN